MLESPVDFIASKVIGRYAIQYSDLHEIGQGGPEVGSIFINGNKVESYLFGGPFLCQENSIYIPAYLPRLLGWRFKIARLELDTLEVQVMGDFKSVIFLKAIEGDTICYYEDVFGHKQASFTVNE